MRSFYADLRRYPVFYVLIAVVCPALYALLLWLDGWCAMPAVALVRTMTSG